MNKPIMPVVTLDFLLVPTKCDEAIHFFRSLKDKPIRVFRIRVHGTLHELITVVR